MSITDEAPLEAAFEAYKRRVAKHLAGQHDQSTHGNRHGFGRPTQSYGNRHILLWKQGKTIVVFNSEGATDDEMRGMEHLLHSIEEMQKRHPIEPLTVEVNDVPFSIAGMHNQESVMGFVTNNEPLIHLRPAAVAPFTKGDASLMPAFEPESAAAYFLAHEWGHVADQRTTVQQAEDDAYIADALTRHPFLVSDYGKTNSGEAYAEAFAQWALAGPGSEGSIQDHLARKYGWGKAGAVAKAARQTLTYVDTFSAAVPPYVIEGSPELP